MGLLDALFPQQDGGFLDFLKRNADAAVANSPGGLPSDMAQYGNQAPMTQPVGYQPGQVQSAPLQQPQPMAQPQPQMPTSLAQPQPMAAPQAPAMAPTTAPSQGGFMPFYQNLHGGGGLIGSIIAGVTGQRNDPQGIAQQQQAQVANQTARALIGKGIPQDVAIAAVQPGNTEMLKTLVDQAFGAPKAPTVLGEGHIWNPKTGKVEQAYEPGAKAPTSLGEGYIWNPSTEKVERAYAPEGKIPIGFQKKADGSLEPIPNGPADPAYIRSKTEAAKTTPNGNQVLGRGGEIIHTNPDGTVTVVHKNEEAVGDATLSEASTKAMASQYLAGDRTVMQNLGRGAQGAANIVKLREEITRQANAAGLDGKGIVDNFNEQAGALAGQRTVGARAANISLAANEANNMIPVALEASEKVPRGSWVPWNQAVQAYQKGTSSPQLASFVAATNSLVNAYVRAVSPGGVPTDSMREHAYSMLNSAQGPDAFKAVVSTMQKEMQAALQAPSQVQKELRRNQPNEAGSPSGAPAPGAYVWTPDKGLQPK